MANVSHASLTGSELHEPKGAATAASGTVYVSNGAGSGTWSAIGTSAFTGMIADFAAPVAPTGWLELDGSVISTSTYSALYGVMTLTSSGTRANGSAIITSIPDTSNLRVGYYAFGTGISTGITIISIDSASQVTLSGNASSSGSGVIVFSPWLLNTGTIKLPDLTTAGRYRRSRTSSTKVGDILADQNKSHTHTVTSTAANAGSHAHGITDPGHNHMTTTVQRSTSTTFTGNNNQAYIGSVNSGFSSWTSDFNVTGITVNSVGDHTHTITSTAASDGGTETRPLTLVVLTCIKT